MLRSSNNLVHAGPYVAAASFEGMPKAINKQGVSWRNNTGLGRESLSCLIETIYSRLHKCIMTTKQLLCLFVCQRLAPRLRHIELALGLRGNSWRLRSAFNHFSAVCSSNRIVRI